MIGKRTPKKSLKQMIPEAFVARNNSGSQPQFQTPIKKQRSSNQLIPAKRKRLEKKQSLSDSQNYVSEDNLREDSKEMFNKKKNINFYDLKMKKGDKKIQSKKETKKQHQKILPNKQKESRISLKSLSQNYQENLRKKRIIQQIQSKQLKNPVSYFDSNSKSPLPNKKPQFQEKFNQIYSQNRNEPPSKKKIQKRDFIEYSSQSEQTESIPKVPIKVLNIPQMKKHNQQASQSKAKPSKQTKKKQIVSENESQQEPPLKRPIPNFPSKTKSQPIVSSSEQQSDTPSDLHKIRTTSKGKFLQKYLIQDTPKPKKVSFKQQSHCPIQQFPSSKTPKNFQPKQPKNLLPTAVQKLQPYLEGIQIYVEGLPSDASGKQIYTHFIKCGDISSFKLLKDSEGRSKGSALITYQTFKGALGAYAYSKTNFLGRIIRVHPSTRQLSKQQNAQEGFNGKSKAVFVTNIPFDSDQKFLVKYFSAFGDVKSVKIGRHPDGSLKGFCIIEFYHGSSADRAIQKSGTKIEGRPLKISYAKSKPIQFEPMTLKGLQKKYRNFEEKNIFK